MNNVQLAAILKKEITICKNALNVSSEIVKKGYRINSGAWANNDSEFYVAFLSCSRDPREETIDLTIDVTLKQNAIVFDTGIYWSEGSLIKDFGSREQHFSSLNDIENIIKDYFLKLNENELKVYSNTVLQE